MANAPGLDSTPPVNQDEAWIAAPGVGFFTTGRFATRLFAGYYGSERHYYDTFDHPTYGRFTLYRVNDAGSAATR